MNKSKKLKILFISPSINDTNGWSRITKNLAIEMNKHVDLDIYIPYNEKVYK
ncbi:MAG: hypothetical protein ACTSUG_02095 [Candidatus Helarchaeota archaeon]